MTDQDPDLIPWLLAARTPSIRYLTLRRLLGRPEDDADVQTAGGDGRVRADPYDLSLYRHYFRTRRDWVGERICYSPGCVSRVSLVPDPAGRACWTNEKSLRSTPVPRRYLAVRL